MQAAQAGFNRIYGVPRNEQPNPLKSRLRSFGLLFLLGGAVILSTAVATVVGTTNVISSGLSLWLQLLGFVLSFAIKVTLFTGAFQLLTARGLHVRHVIRGGVIAALCWEVLQTAGTGYVSERLQHSNAVYGTFEITDADRRAYAMYAATERYKGFQRLSVEFEDRLTPDPGEAASPEDEPVDPPDAEPGSETGGLAVLQQQTWADKVDRED